MATMATPTSSKANTHPVQATVATATSGKVSVPSTPRAGTPAPPPVHSAAAAAAAVAAAAAAAGTASSICPIRLHETVKSRTYTDELLWDMNSQRITPELFSFLLCKDLGLHSSLQEPIIRTIRKQIAEFKMVAALKPAVIEADRKKGLVAVQIDITLHGFRYQDEILWDVHNPHNDVEIFVTGLCADLGLAGDWAAKIAFSMHSQLYSHRKALLLGIPSSAKRVVVSGMFNSHPNLHEMITQDQLRPVSSE